MAHSHVHAHLPELVALQLLPPVGQHLEVRGVPHVILFSSSAAAVRSAICCSVQLLTWLRCRRWRSNCDMSSPLKRWMAEMPHSSGMTGSPILGASFFGSVF